MADAAKSVLVSLCGRARVVKFVGDVNELLQAITLKFSDVFSGSIMYLQVN